MKRLLYTIVLTNILCELAFAGNPLKDYLPQHYEYPLWFEIIGDNILRFLIGIMIFYSISGFPENKLFSFRGIIGIMFSLLFLVLSIVHQNFYYYSLEVGITGSILLIAGLLIIELIVMPVRKGVLKLKVKKILY